MAATTRWFKVLTENGEPNNGSSGRWDLPTQNEDGTWTPGEWREVKGELVPCKNALHATDAAHLFDWIGPRIFDIEYAEPPAYHEGNKVYGRKARLTREYTNWNERTARLLACRIAEDVLPIYEKDYPNDDRPRKAIEVARLFADGKATREELAAARAEAWDAAWAAAWDAAWDAARAEATEKYVGWLLELLNEGKV